MTICAPVTQCCCAEWTIAPGLTLPLHVDWSPTLAQMPGYKLVQVAAAELVKIANPVVPAPDYEIALIAGRDPPPPNPQPGWTEIVDGGYGTVNMVDAGDDLAIGGLYRFDITVYVRDCDGRTGVLKFCVTIYIVAC